MNKIGLVRKSQDRISYPDINADNIFKQKNNLNLSIIQQNNGNQKGQQLGYINYSQPNTGRRQSLGQILAQNNTSLNQQQGASFIGLNGSNQQSAINNSSINMSSVIRNGNINQTRASAQQFLQPNPLRNENLQVSNSLPQLFTNQNSLISLNQLQQQPLINQSQLQYPQQNNQQNSEIINRSYQRERLNRSKLNQSSSIVSLNGGKAHGRKSFYHHSNIFNLKHYKNLTDHIIDGTDIDEIKNNQKSLLIREFRYKVDQYLLFSKYRQEQATKEFNQYYARIQDQLFKTDGYESHKLFMKGLASAAPNGGLSFFSINNEDQNQSLSIIQPELNKSLLNIESNRFNYSKLSKQEASLINNINIDIYLEDQFGKQRHTTHNLNHKKLQDYIIDKMKPLLSNDTEYDRKIEYFTQEYERILEKIQTQSFKIKVPYNYEPQMQPFNEYYKVDNSKLRDSQQQLSWQQIEENLMNQVLEDSNLQNEDIEEEEIHDQEFSQEEESSYEEIEVVEEVQEMPEDINKDEEQNNNKLSSSKKIRSKKQIPSTQQSQNTAMQVFGEEIKVKQVMKIVKKKKKKNKQTYDPNAEENGIEQQQENAAKKAARSKKARNDPNKERSAMEEYTMYRQQQTSPQQENRQKPKPQTIANKKPVNPPVKRAAQPVVGTLQNKIQQNKVPPLRVDQRSPQRVQSIESPRPNNSTIKSSQNNDEEDASIMQEGLIIPQIYPKQQTGQDAQDQNFNELNLVDEKIIVTEDDNTGFIQKGYSNNATPLDMQENPQGKKTVRKVTNQNSIKSNQGAQPDGSRDRKESSTSIQQKASQQKIDSSIRFRTEESKNDNNDNGEQLQIQDDEQEDEYEEVIQFVNEEIVNPDPQKNISDSQKIEQQSNPQIRAQNNSVSSNTSRTNQQQQQLKQQNSDINTPVSQQDQTPQSIRPAINVNSQRSMNTPSNQNKQEAGFSYFADIKIKRKVGTGLIDDLVKINYLLDFNVTNHKKERKLPELPRELEFKQEQDKQLFESIFKWQYEVDLDIAEMEEHLQIPVAQRRDAEDSDDEDDEDRNRKRSSVHSSDITDFGEPAPDKKNSLQNISSDGLSDIE